MDDMTFREPSAAVEPEDSPDRDYRRLIVRRLPLFAALWLGLAVLWSAAEVASGRRGPLSAAAYIGFVCMVCLAAGAWCRRDPAAPRVRWIALVTCQILALASAAMLVFTDGSREVLAFSLFILCLASSFMFAWGWRTATLLALGTFLTWQAARPWLHSLVGSAQLAIGGVVGSIVWIAIAEVSARSFRTVWYQRRAERRAMHALALSRDAYRDLAENASDLIYTHDLVGRLTYVNEAFARYFGTDRSSQVGRFVMRVLDARRVNPDIPATIAKLVAGEAVPPLVLAVTTAEGSRWLECAVSGIRDGAGRVVGVQGVARDVTERRRAEELLDERRQIWGLAADVGAALTETDSLATSLQRCAQAIVQHFDAAFARIWTVDAEGRVLELQASAGMYTHIDGRHSRVPIGSLKIGLIAQERTPLLTNRVLGDPRVHDQEWARREGLVAFAGYPLIVDNRLIGVMALFARKPLPESAITALGSVARAVALGVERMRAEEALRASYEEVRRRGEKLQRLARHQSVIREEERERFGSDLHDGVCQELVGIGIQLEALRVRLGVLEPDVAGAFERLGRYLTEVVDHLRSLAYDLRPMVLLDLGLEESLRSLVRAMSSPATSVSAAFATPLPPVDDHTALAFYRVAQEALTNAARHARAKSVVLDLGAHRDVLRLEVRDDGCGFSPAERRQAETIGLVSMEERAHAIGGRLEITSAPGRGTTVRLEYPLVARARESAA